MANSSEQKPYRFRLSLEEPWLFRQTDEHRAWVLGVPIAALQAPAKPCEKPGYIYYGKITGMYMMHY